MTVLPSPITIFGDSKPRDGILLFMYDDTDKMEAILGADISVFIDCGDYLRCITLPKNTYTDFASTPRFLWSILPPVGKHTKAAIIHDYMYTVKLDSRKVADYVFRETMRANGVGFVRRWAMWLGVRLFGRKHWGEKNG